jgi:hypothetical protein
VPVRAAAVLAIRDGFLGLAELLESPVAVNPRGVASLLALITDGSSPLFHDSGERSLADAFWEIADALQLCPPHDWRCPVIIKLDPDHVAWTCARCGATAKASHAEQPAE